MGGTPQDVRGTSTGACLPQASPLQGVPGRVLAGAGTGRQAVETRRKAGQCGCLGARQLEKEGGRGDLCIPSGCPRSPKGRKLGRVEGLWWRAWRQPGGRGVPACLRSLLSSS